jgi:hypothetical protein
MRMARPASNTVKIAKRGGAENASFAGYEGTGLMLSPAQDAGKEVLFVVSLLQIMLKMPRKSPKPTFISSTLSGLSSRWKVPYSPSDVVPGNLVCCLSSHLPYRP